MTAPTPTPDVELRPMRVGDVDWLSRWDADPDVAAALGGPATEWYDWPTELEREVDERELLIVEEDHRPVGFVQLLDAHRDPSKYWGDVEVDTWSLDIWVGSPSDRGRGVGTAAMDAAIDRVFERHGARRLLIDPQIGNQRAISFYRRLGFETVEQRRLGDDECLVMRLERRPSIGEGGAEETQ